MIKCSLVWFKGTFTLFKKQAKIEYQVDFLLIWSTYYIHCVSVDFSIFWEEPFFLYNQSQTHNLIVKIMFKAIAHNRNDVEDLCHLYLYVVRLKRERGWKKWKDEIVYLSPQRVPFYEY